MKALDLDVLYFILAHTGWQLNYINSLPEDHIVFVYHHLQRKKL